METAGETAAGLAQLDEATAAAVSGEMSIPNAIGATCCYPIFACERVHDYDRAVQWCNKVQEFCREVKWASLFATCRTHHASVLMWQGAWAEAETELELAVRELDATRPGDANAWPDPARRAAPPAGTPRGGDSSPGAGRLQSPRIDGARRRRTGPGRGS